MTPEQSAALDRVLRAHEALRAAERAADACRRERADAIAQLLALCVDVVTIAHQLGLSRARIYHLKDWAQAQRRKEQPPCETTDSTTASSAAAPNATPTSDTPAETATEAVTRAAASSPTR